MKVLCIGSAAYDITLLMDSYPVENTKYRVKEEIKCGGGPSSNAAYLLGKWGIETYFSGVVGKDTHGENIIDEFKSVGVNTKFIEINSKKETTLGFIIVNNKNGSRTTFTHRKEDIKLTKKINIKPDIILIDGQEVDASIEVIKNNPNAISVIDAGRASENVIKLSKRVNYVVCSKTFAEDYTKVRVNLSDPNSIKEIYSILERDFKNVVITLEDKGCLYKKDNMIKLMPSIKVIPKDTTGAGDLFHGAFVYCLANKFDIEKTVRISNITGALATTKVGSRYKVPELKEVLKIYEENV